jgi:hypothetical protein
VLYLEPSFVWAYRKVDQKYLEGFKMWRWRKMEKMCWSDRVKNVEVCKYGQRGKEYPTHSKNKNG